MDDYADDMRFKNILSHEVHVTRGCSQVVQLARVGVVFLLLMWFVSCLSSVFLSFFMLYLHSFRGQFSLKEVYSLHTTHGSIPEQRCLLSFKKQNEMVEIYTC